jgi:hypothetical protein
MQGTKTICVGGVYIGALIDEPLHSLLVSIRDGVVKWN